MLREIKFRSKTPNSVLPPSTCTIIKKLKVYLPLSGENFVLFLWWTCQKTVFIHTASWNVFQSRLASCKICFLVASDSVEWLTCISILSLIKKRRGILNYLRSTAGEFSPQTRLLYISWISVWFCDSVNSAVFHILQQAWPSKQDWQHLTDVVFLWKNSLP